MSNPIAIGLVLQLDEVHTVHRSVAKSQFYVIKSSDSCQRCNWQIIWMNIILIPQMYDNRLNIMIISSRSLATKKRFFIATRRCRRIWGYHFVCLTYKRATNITFVDIPKENCTDSEKRISCSAIPQIFCRNLQKIRDYVNHLVDSSRAWHA